jgi:hypothetical protein
MWSCLQNP